MVRCAYCDSDIDELAFSCNGCSLVLCSKHRLPENHGCDASPVSKEKESASRHAPEPMELEPSRTLTSEWKDQARKESDVPAVTLKEKKTQQDAPREHLQGDKQPLSRFRSIAVSLVVVVVIALAGGALVMAVGPDINGVDSGGTTNSSDYAQYVGGDDGVVTSETVVYEDGLIGGNDDVNEVIAHDNGTLELVFKDQNQADGFVLMHAYHDDPVDENIVYAETPAFGESVMIDFVGAIEGETYPNNEFAIQFHKGNFCELGGYCYTVVDEKLDRIKFEVPEEFLEPEFGDEDDDDGNTTIGM